MNRPSLLAERSYLLVHGQGDPGTNLALARWRTKLKSGFQHVIINNHGFMDRVRLKHQT